MATKSECVKVAVRVKPLDRKEINENDKSMIKIDCDCNRNELYIESKDCTKREFTKKYSFNHVFDERNNQNDIYKKCISPIIKSVLKGYNGTIFVYGQSGTGKTYIMEGDDINNNNINNKGIIPQTFTQIMEYINNSNKNIEFVVRISYLEIYKDEVYDLINKNKREKMVVKEGENGFYVKDLSMHSVKSINDMFKIFKKGEKTRSIGTTLINPNNSSRSHCILTINITNSNSYIESKLNLVDLAGFDRQKKTVSVSDETKFINLSLSALGNVINALSNNTTTHIPYRDSKLTRLLSDSLGGNTKTIMIANISQSLNNLDETISTLRYANHAKNIKNKPRINNQKIKKQRKGEKTGKQIIKKEGKCDKEKNVMTPKMNEELQSLQKQLKDEKIANNDSNESQIKDEEKTEIISINTEKAVKIEKEKDVTIANMNDELENLQKQTKGDHEKILICNKCTFINDCNSSKCEMCGLSILSKEENKYEWQCKICTFINKSTQNIFCQICGTKQQQQIDEIKVNEEEKSCLVGADEFTLSVSQRKVIADTYYDITQEIIKSINKKKNRFSLLKNTRNITGPDNMKQNEWCDHNFWDNIRTLILTIRLDFDYDEWMRDKQQYQTQLINELSKILCFESKQITIKHYRRGSVLSDVYFEGMWSWWNGRTNDQRAMQKQYLYNISIDDQIRVQYKNKWYNATVSKIHDDGDKRFQVRYNPENDTEGRDPFIWNTEWFYGCTEATRWTFDGQNIYPLRNKQEEIFNIPRKECPALTRKRSIEDIEINDHIFVNFDKQQGWSRCVVYIKIRNRAYAVKSLKNGNKQNLDLLRKEDRDKISFEDMR